MKVDKSLKRSERERERERAHPVILEGMEFGRYKTATSTRCNHGIFNTNFVSPSERYYIETGVIQKNKQ